MVGRGWATTRRVTPAPLCQARVSLPRRMRQRLSPSRSFVQWGPPPWRRLHAGAEGWLPRPRGVLR
jgi:hypothetical protein